MTSLLSTLVVAAAFTSMSCTGNATDPSSETIDTIRLQLDFGGGVTLTSLNYVLSGPGTFKRTGQLTLGADPTVSATFQNLPAGAYNVMVQGTATDDASFCRGQAMFTVSSMMDAVVQIPLTCSGRASVSADVHTCPLIDGLSAVPSEVFVGSSIQLVSEVYDPDGLSPITPTWTTSSGTLSGPSATGATFTCTAPGMVTITFAIADATPGNICMNTLSLTVICTAGP